LRGADLKRTAKVIGYLVVSGLAVAGAWQLAGNILHGGSILGFLAATGTAVAMGYLPSLNNPKAD
jgi:acyl-CoA hydrolase